MTLDAAKKGAGEKLIDNLGDSRLKGTEKWEYKVKSANGRGTRLSAMFETQRPET